MKIQKRQYILAVLAAFLAFALSACGSRDSVIVMERRGTGARTVKAETTDNDGTEEEITVETGQYILLKLDTERKLAVFRKDGSSKQSQYAYDTGTKFLDKYGGMRPMTSFLPGDVVEIDVSRHTQQLTRIQMSAEAWVQEDIVNYSVEKSIRAFTIGRTKYSYDSDLPIFSGEDVIDFESIGESDVLRAVGIDKKLVSLSVMKGHGTLALTNTTLFENSFICIGDKIFEEVTKDMQIEVPEGEYLVTVANNGYGGSREVTIERNLVTSLNLDELKGEGPKICKIKFDVGVEGARLYIDDKKADYSAPVEVQYGIHTVAVEADGYDPIVEKLVVNSPEAEIEIALTASAGSSSDKDDKDNSKPDSNNNGNSGAGGNTNNNNNSNNNNNNNNSNTNNNGNTNNTNNGNNSNGNNNNNGNHNSNGNTTSQTDYLTTLYNLLNSINNAGASSNESESYDDLRDQ